MKKICVTLLLSAITVVSVLAQDKSNSGDLSFTYVDLGLSVLWADCNLGAAAPSEYGNYYAWGETEPKAFYSWDNYHNYEPPRDEPLEEYDELLQELRQIGGNRGRNRGRNYEPLKLQPANDAATVLLGAEWHMPTIDDYDELYANCDYDTVTVNGVIGLRYTSRIAGYEDRSIFIPYGGYMEGTEITGEYLAFWTWTSQADNRWDGDSGAILVSTSNTINPAYFFKDEEKRNDIGTIPSQAQHWRYKGLSIRPVRQYDLDSIISFELSTDKMNLDFGEIVKVNAVSRPSGRQIENGNIQWGTSSDQVAVCKDGKVTAIGVGTCVITAEYNGQKAQMTVNVTMPELIPVDLGLSVKWASANLGASSPRKAGAYIAWGDTSPKAGLYLRDDYKTVWTEKLEPEKDAVMVRIGGGWRMPDADDLWELKNKCSWQTIDTKDSCGYIITSNVPGYEDRSIFLPAVGHKTDSEGRVGMNLMSYGSYKTITYNTLVADVSLGSTFKWEGCPIRPVLDTGEGKKAGPDPVKPLNHDAMVDLGLSVLWADCNVGADSPEECGARFAWGETAEKTYYTKYNYKLNGKYNSWEDRNKLDAAHDAAHVNWGGEWRMPTKEEYAELFKNCEWADTTINGVEGFLFTSKVPGYTSNSIFLPFTNGGIYKADRGLYLTSDASFRYENSCVAFTISKYKSGTNDEVDLGLENYEDWGYPNSEIHIPSRSRHEGGWVRAVCPK